MATPSSKAPHLEKMLEEKYGRTTAIINNVCIPAPSGCGKPAVKFRDEPSQREYTMSGLCQDCQDDVFGF